MWTIHNERLPVPPGLRCVVEFESRPGSYAEVLHAWQTDAVFRGLFNSVLAGAPFDAFRWETPAVTTKKLSQPFEFVLLDSPGLVQRPDKKAFAKHFSDAKEGIAVFPNLGRDAIMIVPSPAADVAAYGHLAAFVRHAPPVQRDALWRAVAATMTQRVSSKPVWLSTAGAGVSWLHVRLDDRPKYYGFVPYRNA